MTGAGPRTGEAEPLLWYFAYGSNLAPEIFQERRGLEPAEVRAGYLDGYRLVFDLPVGPGERGVANITPADDRVHGVAYLLDVAQAERLDRSEGVPHGVYARITVALRCGEDRVAAFTYQSQHRQADRKPSPRYIGLIQRGAEHHRLPAAYREWLGRHPIARDERAGDEREAGSGEP